jgi:hypothetical protein
VSPQLNPDAPLRVHSLSEGVLRNIGSTARENLPRHHRGPVLSPRTAAYLQLRRAESPLLEGLQDDQQATPRLEDFRFRLDRPALGGKSLELDHRCEIVGIAFDEIIRVLQRGAGKGEQTVSSA